MTPAGFPHSDIPGSKSVCDSPGLIAAYHVLHRLLVPRHPPCALSSLTGLRSKGALVLYAQRLIFDCQRSRAARQRRGRRGDHLAASRNLYIGLARSLVRNPLSYLVEIAGLEPAASGLQSRRSPS